MSEDTIEQTPQNRSDEDLTGRSHLVSNVLFSWAAYGVYIIAGFVMPRMIDGFLGQGLLGVWDFAWSLVSYFGIVQAGIGSSVDRYVARYRAAGETVNVNRVVSSATAVMALSCSIVMALTITVVMIIPSAFGAKLGKNVAEAQWVVFFLGSGIATQIGFSGITSVLTGCHRWKIHNIIKSGWHAATIVGMLTALLLGGSLRHLAFTTFMGLLMADICRTVMCYRVCPGLKLRPSLVEIRTIRKLFVFGGKTLMPSLSNMLLTQTTSLLIIGYLGPAALALYTRPRSLIRHMNTLVNKMAMTLTPTTSSLQSTGRMDEVANLLIRAGTYSYYLVLPMVLVLVIFGGAILGLWMGPSYANNLLPAILAAGYLATIVQMPVLNLLVGLNAHGRAGMAQLLASITAVGLVFLVLRYTEWALTGTALGVVLPLTVANVIYLPVLICRKVNLEIKRYFFEVALTPTIRMLPFAACLIAARLVFLDNPRAALGWAFCLGSPVLAVIYWRFVLPDRIKSWACRFVPARSPAA